MNKVPVSKIIEKVEAAADKAGLIGEHRQERIAVTWAFMYGFNHPESCPRTSYYTRADLDRIFGKKTKRRQRATQNAERTAQP